MQRANKAIVASWKGRPRVGFPRLQKVVKNSTGGDHLIEECLAELEEFAGHAWEQEDDITLVTLQRTSYSSSPNTPRSDSPAPLRR